MPKPIAAHKDVIRVEELAVLIKKLNKAVRARARLRALEHWSMKQADRYDVLSLEVSTTVHHRPGDGPAAGGARLGGLGMSANPTQFQPGDAHPRFAGGTTTNDKGYIRVSVGRRSMPYEHRYRIEQLMAEQEILRRTALILAGKEEEDAWLGEQLTVNQRIAREAMDVLSNPPRLPPNVHIHHIDGDKTHNCPCNLMLLDQVLHNHITQCHRRFLRRAEDERIRRVLRGEL